MPEKANTLPQKKSRILFCLFHIDCGLMLVIAKRDICFIHNPDDMEL